MNKARETGTVTSTETIEAALGDLDLRPTSAVLDALLDSQRRALDAVARTRSALDTAVGAAAERLRQSSGRLVYAGAGASGRLAVQDGAELWPTFGWPASRLVLAMAGGEEALLSSVEGVEDDAASARQQAEELVLGKNDVVVALAASGASAWTCAWLEVAGETGALGIGFANNDHSRLLDLSRCPVLLETGPEVLAGSTRMAAGTSQKIVLNLFSTALMVRLNRTYGNLMVDMAAVNAKLDARRVRMLQDILPTLDEHAAREALAVANGWVKLAALIASGHGAAAGRALLELHDGSLRAALAASNSA